MPWNQLILGLNYSEVTKLIFFFTKEHMFYIITLEGEIIMKVYAKPIEMVSYTKINGEIHPIRFRMQLEDESVKVIKVDRIITKSDEKLAGNNMIIFRCQSVINGVQTLFEIKYELSTCKWMLFKM